MQFFPAANMAKNIMASNQSNSSMWGKGAVRSGQGSNFTDVLSQLAVRPSQNVLGASSTGLSGSQTIGREEIAVLTPYLRKFGLDEQTISDFTSKVSDGLTWGEVVQTIQDKLGPSEELKAELKNTFTRLGFVDSQAQSMASDVADRRLQDILNKNNLVVNQGEKSGAQVVWSQLKDVLDQSSMGRSENAVVQMKELVRQNESGRAEQLGSHIRESLGRNASSKIENMINQARQATDQNDVSLSHIRQWVEQSTSMGEVRQQTELKASIRGFRQAVEQSSDLNQLKELLNQDIPASQLRQIAEKNSSSANDMWARLSKVLDQAGDDAEQVVGQIREALASEKVMGQLKDALGKEAAVQSNNLTTMLKQASEQIASGQASGQNGQNGQSLAGSFDRVWTQFKALLDNTPAGQEMLVDANDLTNMVKALPLSDSVKTELESVIKGFGDSTISKEQLQSFMNTLQGKVTESETMLSQMYNKLAEVKTQAQASAAEQTRSEAEVGRKKDLAEARKTIPLSAEESREQTGNATGQRLAGQETRPQQPATDKSQAPAMAKSESPSQGDDPMGQSLTKEESRPQSGDKSLPGPVNTEARPAAKAEAPLEGREALFNLNQNTQNAAQTPLAASAQNRENISSQLSRQMDNMIFSKDNSNGIHRLTLELTPATLGKVLVTVQVMEGEVRAMIRAQDPETTKLLTDQAHLIRQSMEQQGLKVEKLDIQTQLQENPRNSNGSDWQGSAQHNQTRDNFERSRKDSSNRILAANGQSMALNMQPQDDQAKVSGNGLVDILA